MEIEVREAQVHELPGIVHVIFRVGGEAALLQNRGFSHHRAVFGRHPGRVNVVIEEIIEVLQEFLVVFGLLATRRNQAVAANTGKADTLRYQG